MTEISLKDFLDAKDPESNASAAFRRALDSLNASGGGRLTVPRGLWRTGPVELGSHTELHLEAGAVLSFIPDPALYVPVPTRWEGIECHGMHPCVFSSGTSAVSITGEGSIDGNGSVWWDLLAKKREARQTKPELPIERSLASLNPGYEDQPGGGGGRGIQFLRPPLIQFFNCTAVLLEGITVLNSPFWTVHPVYCDNVIIRRLTIRNPHDAPNTDGIDIDSCTNVLISDCDVRVGDDGICLKSGSGIDGLRVNKPTRFVTVRDCFVGDGHGGVVIGSETAGGISDVLAERCTFSGTDRGVRIKTRRGRGGTISGIDFRDLTMENNICPLAINMFYRCGASLEDGFFETRSLPVDATTPVIRDVKIRSVRATGCKASAGFIAGLPESPIEDLIVEDCSFVTDEQSGISPQESEMFLGLPPVGEKSIRVLNAPGARFINVTVKGPQEPIIER